MRSSGRRLPGIPPAWLCLLGLVASSWILPAAHAGCDRDLAPAAAASGFRHLAAADALAGVPPAPRDRCSGPSCRRRDAAPAPAPASAPAPPKVDSWAGLPGVDPAGPAPGVLETPAAGVGPAPRAARLDRPPRRDA